MRSKFLPMIYIKFKRVEWFYMHCWVTQIYSLMCTVIYISVRNWDLKSNHPLMLLQPLLGPGLTHKLPPFVCLPLISSILISLGSVMCPSRWCPSILFLFFPLVLYNDPVLRNFPLRNAFWDIFIFHSHNTTHPSYITNDIYIFV